MSIIDSACFLAVDIANDDSHGYDQIKRWSPDFDCSSLVISAFEFAGLKVREAGASYTGNMRTAFVRCGFISIPYTRGMMLKRGDVILNVKHHVCLYIGDGKIVQASINEKGTTTGGKTGDQTGKEIAICNFYEYSRGWDYVLRFPEGEEVNFVNVTLPELREGMRRPEVGMVQTLLRELNFKGTTGRDLVIDNDFGKNTSFAVANFQKSVGLNADSVIGPKTYDKLFKANY